MLGSCGPDGRLGGIAQKVAIETFCGYMTQPKLVGIMDVVEIFDGVGGVGGLAVRRRLNSGEQGDICTGLDLTQLPHQRHVPDYIEARKPLVIVLAPPCVSSGHWAHFNKVASGDLA